MEKKKKGRKKEIEKIEIMGEGREKKRKKKH